jgi:integrase/recombinase XerC
MGRKSKGPWWWKERNEWGIHVRGKRYALGTDKAEAERLWHELMAEPEPASSGVSEPAPDTIFVSEILAMFLIWCKKHRDEGTFQWYRQRLQEFDDLQHDLTIKDMKQHHVQSWIDKKNASGHQRGCLIAVNRAMNWAEKQGHILKNPIKGMEKPAAGRRDILIEPDVYAKMLSLCNDAQFVDLLTFSWETGSRPQEAYRLEGRHLDLAHKRIIFPELESKGKKKKRIIYLNPTALEIVKRLAAINPTGKLFRNEDGKAWRRNNVACRFSRMRGALGREILTEKGLMPTDKEIESVKITSQRQNRKTKDFRDYTPSEKRKIAREGILRKRIKKLVPMYCLYNYRHTWITRMLKAGNDPITVATLAGHSDVTMLCRVYAHVINDTDHLQAALAKLLS